MAGWSLDLIIIIQFFFNVFLYCKDSILKFWTYAKSYVMKRRVKRAPKHDIKEGFDEIPQSGIKIPSIDSPEPYRLDEEVPSQSKT